MEKRMLEMMKRFEDGAFDQDFDSSSFFKNSNSFGYDWREDETYKILSLKVKQVKDRPLDIKIEKGMIKIKGSVEENSSGKKYMSQFERTYSIPHGVDEKNPEFENKEGEVLIKFKKISKKKKKANDGERIPISPDDKNIQF
jgi:HSP20 family molecular chaperone IbpA